MEEQVTKKGKEENWIEEVVFKRDKDYDEELEDNLLLANTNRRNAHGYILPSLDCDWRGRRGLRVNSFPLTAIGEDGGYIHLSLDCDWRGRRVYSQGALSSRPPVVGSEAATKGTGY
eukprot:1180696-Prorocentrum_minimum.AAC.5